MQIGGLQKLTLLDFPGYVACTVFTVGCNFRCPFCHNASLVTGGSAGSISQDEFFAFLETRKGKLDGVCITGGEPLLQKDLADFIKKIRSLGFLVKLDTNGSLPQKLKELLDKGLLDYVAMDIKNSPKRYAETAGIPWLETRVIAESVSIIRQSGVPHEFRTTLVKELHTREDISDLASLFGGDEPYFLQSFKDSGDTIEKGFSPHSHEELKRLKAAAAQGFPKAELRGE